MMMPLWCNKANLYTLGWCLYYLQGTLYPTGSFIPRFILIVLLIVSLYYCFYANFRYKLPTYFVGLNMLVMLFSVYGVYFMIMYEKNGLGLPSFYYLKLFWASQLPVYAYYVFFKENQISERFVYIWFFVFFIIATAAFELNSRVFKLMGMQEVTNNMGYSFLSLLPACVLLYKKTIIQYIALGYCVSFILMGMKRGAIIIGFICLVWFIWNKMIKQKGKMKIRIVFLSLIFIFFSYIFVQHQMEESFLFRRRVESTINGDSSGRDELYSGLVDFFWNETDPIHFFWGGGADKSIEIVGNYAHNDWLEIAVNQGMFGLMLYITFWIIFFKACFFRMGESNVCLAKRFIFVICFMKSLFSMSYSEMPICMLFVLGYCLSLEDKK